MLTIHETARVGSVLLVHAPLAQDPDLFARAAKRVVKADGSPRTDLLRVRVTRVLPDPQLARRVAALELRQAADDGLLLGPLPRWLEVVPA